MSFSVIIPARYGSTRLPGKPLADIAGKPMIQHVWEKACKSSASEVIIATDHKAIVSAAENFGAQVMLTSREHLSGTDRLQEVCAKKEYNDKHVVINLQGDEPLFPAAQLDELYKNICKNDHAGIATLCCPLDDWSQMLNPNVVKVVRDASNIALYFSRAPIPWTRDTETSSQFAGKSVAQSSFTFNKSLPTNCFRHLGVYAYRVEILNKFVSWPPGALESIEALEQLRAMENGVKIHCAEASYSIPEGVDTEEDLQNIRQILA